MLCGVDVLADQRDANGSPVIQKPAFEASLPAAAAGMRSLRTDPTSAYSTVAAGAVLNYRPWTINTLREGVEQT